MQNKRLFMVSMDFSAVDKPPIFLGTVKQLDGVTLEITPLAGYNPMTMVGVTPKLYAKKPNGEFVYQDVDIDVDLSTSQMTIQCKNFMFSDVGTVEMEIELYDDDNYLITSPTFEIDVAQKLNQLEMEDLKEGIHISLLEELMDYVAESKDYVERFKELLSEFGDDDTVMLENLIVVKTMLETLSSEVDRLENTITQAQEYEFEMANQETARVAAEEKRVGAEALRVQGETNRVNEEAKRRTTEQARVSAEEIRVQNEAERVQNEAERVQNEEERKIEEKKRISMYNIHLNDELRREQKHTEMVNTFDTKVSEVNTFVDTKKQEINSFVNTKTEEVEEFVDLKTNQVNNFITTKTTEVNAFVTAKGQEVQNAINAIPPKSELIGAKGDKGDKGEKGDTPSITHLETSINNKISDVETRFNALTSSQQQSSEVIDARDGETSLKARLDRDVEKTKQVYVNVEGSHISTDSSVGYLKDVEILGNTIQDASNLADIRSVGDKVEGQELYEIPVVSCGENLFDLSKLSGGEFTTLNGKNVYKYIDNASFYFYNGRFKKDTQYTITMTMFRDVGYEAKGLNLQIEYTDGTSKNFTFTHGVTRIITSEKGKTIEKLSGSYNHGLNAYIDLDSICLNEGDVAINYQPYQEDKLTILSPVQLEKVGDVADRIIEKDGVWGVEKNIKTIVLDGSESYWRGIMTDGGITNNMTYVSGTPFPLDNMANRNGICDRLQLIQGNQFTFTGYNQIALHNSPMYSNYMYISTQCSSLEEFKQQLSANPITLLYTLKTPQFIPLPHDQQIKLRTFANKTNISFLTEIEGTIKAQVPKSLGATVNTHTEQINNLNKELDRVKKLEESTVSTVTTESDFTTVEATSNGYFEDVKLEGKTLVNLASTTWTFIGTYYAYLLINNLKINTTYTVIAPKCNTTFRYAVFQENGTVGIQSYQTNAIFTFNSGDNTSIRLYCKATTTDGTENTEGTLVTDYNQVLLLEGDHTQNPPSYFEGLKSVGDTTDEISVESTDDGNIWDGVLEYGSIGAYTGEDAISTSHNRSKNYIYVIDDLNYYVNIGNIEDITSRGFRLIFYKYAGAYHSYMDLKTSKVIKIPKGVSCMRFVYDSSQKVYDISITKGSEPKEYQPSKQDKKRLLYYNNETQTWEKPILREWDSIEKHSDGKYYYHQRSAEVVLNGSENFGLGTVKSNTIGFTYNCPGGKQDGNVIATHFQKGSYYKDVECVHLATNNVIFFRILNTKLSTQDITGFKQWLQANNVTVVYQLAQEKVYECTNIDLITYANETNYIVESGVLSPKTTLKVHNNISNVVSLLQKKVSLLESNVKASQEVQDMMILETDMRMLDIELALMEFAPMKLNLGGSNMLRSATYFNFLKNHIVNETYEKEYLENVMNKYLATGRINQDEYNELYKMLYPPVYDIELPIEY